VINIYSIIVTAFAIVGVVATVLKLVDVAEREVYLRRNYASTRRKLPRATVRRLRAARIALHERLLDRRAS
jgi:hypothetical protein